MNTKFLPFAFALLLAPAVFAQDYVIKLHRGSKPGDRVKLSLVITQTQNTNVTVNGETKKDEKKEMGVQFEGIQKSVEVDDQGRDTKVILTVDKLTKTTDGGTSEVVPKGTVITGSYDADHKKVFEIDGKAVDADVAKVLNMVVQLSHGGPTDDDIFGTAERKKKGDTWDVNADLAMKDMKASGGGVELKNLTGKTTLDDVADGALKISSHIKAEVAPPTPANVVVDEATAEGNFGGVFPIDTTKSPAEQSVEMTMSITMHAEGPGGKAVIKSLIHSTRKGTITDLK